VGSVMVIMRLGAVHGLARRAAVAATTAGAVTFVVVLASALPTTGNWIAVDSAAAAQLGMSQSRIPAGAEVIASQGIVGRFSGRDDVYPFPYQYHPPGTSLTTFPVKRPVVVFVLTPAQGTSEAPRADGTAAVRFVEHRLGARVIDARAGVYVLAWTPPPGTTSVTLANVLRASTT
jgi:hypothetical protein